MSAYLSVSHQVNEIEARLHFLQRAFMAHWANMISGDYAEFGCAGAMTFRSAYQASRANLLQPHLWAFDSFKGLPSSSSSNEHPRWLPGAMVMTRDEFVRTLDSYGLPRTDYTLVEGFYDDTLSEGSPESEGYCRDVALAYVDCDLYDSAAAVLRFLSPSLRLFWAEGCVVSVGWAHTGFDFVSM